MPNASPHARLDVLLSEASLSHLAAAAALSRRGLRVCVLQGEQPDGVPPWALPPLGLLPPANTGTLLDELFSTCDIPPPVRRSFRSPRILFQIVWPGVRADVLQNPQAHEAGLVREFGEGEARRMLRLEQGLADQAAGLVKAIERTPVFPPSGFFSRFGKGRRPEGISRALGHLLERPFSEVLEEAQLSAESRRYFQLYLAASAFLLQKEPTAAAAAAVLNPQVREHTLLPPPDAPELRDLLTVQIARRGVSLGEGAAREIRKGAEGTWEVDTTQGQRLRTRALVEGEKAIQERLAGEGSGYWRTHTLKVSFSAEAIPVGLCPRGVLLAAPEEEWKGGNLIFWSLERPAESNGTARIWATLLAEETRTTATRAAPAAASVPGEPLRAKVLSGLARIVPFLPESLSKTAWMPTAAEGTWLTGPTRNLGLVGMGLKAGRRSRYALGRSNLPALGVWGEIKSAFSLAHLVGRKLGG